MEEEELITDGSLAESSSERTTLWKYREDISESLSINKKLYKNDVSVPIAQLANLLPNLELLIKSKYTQYKLYCFGHIADGNVHINIVDTTEASIEDFMEKMQTLENDLYRLIASLSGSISAEHGIGLSKKEKLHYRRSDVEIKLMQQIKAVLDPKYLLNPDKVFNRI